MCVPVDTYAPPAASNRTLSKLTLLLPVAALAACSAGSTSNAESGENDITSLTALAPTLYFQGTVYLKDGASDAEVLAAVKHQTQSGLGAFRTASIGVTTRELHTIDTSTFVKEKVTVVDPANPNDAGTPMTRVTYTYTDDAVLPAPDKDRASISLALLAGSYESQ